MPSRKLLTACIAIGNDGLRFDEHFLGSGFEDDDFCMQLREKYPDGIWLILHDVKVIHTNEKKNQAAPWLHNRRHFETKWGVQWGKQ